MAPPRQLVDQEHAACYHVTSRCVRRAWLSGYDPYTRRHLSHRRRWVIGRMAHLERSFAVEILGHAVMSTHFHMVLHYDPKACEAWTDEEVARRWVEALPVRVKGRVSERRNARKRELLIKDPEGLARARRSLGSLPDFMKHLRITPQPHACGFFLTTCFKMIYAARSVPSSAALMLFHYNDFATFRRCVPARDSASPRGTACFSTRATVRGAGKIATSSARGRSRPGTRGRRRRLQPLTGRRYPIPEPLAEKDWSAWRGRVMVVLPARAASPAPACRAMSCPSVHGQPDDGFASPRHLC